jgi:HD-GYP domain-containing protein (c-di-GMP phosphodiesterase class II)
MIIRVNSKALPTKGTTPTDEPPAQARRRHRVACDQLVEGLYVVDLDRPWLDTPFLIQGFMIESEVELTTLQKHCQYVFVDLEMSLEAPAEQLFRAAAEGFEPTRVNAAPKAAPVRDDASGWLARAKAIEKAGETENAAMLRAAEMALDDADPLPMAEDLDAAARAVVVPEKKRTAAVRRNPQRTYQARDDIQISKDTRDRFRQFVRATADQSEASAAPESIGTRLMDSLRGLLRRGQGGSGTRGRGSEDRQDRETGKPDGDTRSGRPTAPKALGLDQEIEAALPPGTRREKYSEKVSVEQELPRARTAFEAGEGILSSLLSDIQANRAPEIKDVKEAVGHMVDSMIDNPDALLWVAQLRAEHELTYQHGLRVSLYMIALGRQLGFPKEMIDAVGLIGMLADVGKTKLPRALLGKPGMLNAAEFGLAKEHVRLGIETLGDSPLLTPDIEEGIVQHHERLDGSGYPNGLKGNQISIFGRMAGIADCFSALTTARPYANALAAQDAMMSLYQWAGTLFQETLVEQFVQSVGVFPVGCLVELSSGEVAAVIAHNRVRRLEPRILVLTSPDKRALPTPVERDLLVQQVKAGTKPTRISRGLAAGAYGLKLSNYYLNDTFSRPLAA